MEWELTFSEEKHLTETAQCLIRLGIKFPKDCSISLNKWRVIINPINTTHNLTLSHIINYWRQRVPCHKKIESTISYIWSRSCCSLLSDLRTGIHSDFYFTMNASSRFLKKKFFVHKIILSAASNYFTNLFKTTKENDIELNDIDPIIFDKILDFIYGKRVLLGNHMGLKIMNLFISLKKYEINIINEKEMRDIIETVDNIKTEEAMDFLNLGNILFDNSAPDWFKRIFFEKIVSKDSKNTRALLKTLPSSLVDFFNESYFLSSDDENDL